MLPPESAVAPMVNELIEKYAWIRWSSAMFVKSYEGTMPWLTPSTTTLSTWDPVFAVPRYSRVPLF